MKKTLVSIAAASLIVSSAMAADKGIDIVTTGQAVVYYQTAANNGDVNTDLFNDQDSKANVGIQLDLAADLKNDFTFGAQLSYLDALGLNKNLVGDTNVMQILGGTPNTSTASSNITDDIAMTQVYIAKKIANTTVKIGRQALPQALSPMAFSEDWSVFQNTFEAVLVVNSDIPDTTVVGAYVGGGNHNEASGANLDAMDNLSVKAETAPGASTSAPIDGTAYMLTVQNSSLPMTTITGSYYDLAQIQAGSLEGASIVWGDVAIADKSLPMGLKIGIQGGDIMPEDSTNIADTTAWGVKVDVAPVEKLSLTAAYSSVDGDDNKANVGFVNAGGIKTPLYTQMILNQDAIALDANTFMLKAAYNTGDFGTIIAQGTVTSAGESNYMNKGRDLTGTDYTDLELVYKVKAGGVDFLAAYINQAWSDKNANNMDSSDTIRVVARYNF